MNRWTVMGALLFFSLACSGGAERTVTIVSPKDGAVITGDTEVRVEVTGNKTADWELSLDRDNPGSWVESPDDAQMIEVGRMQSGPLTVTATIFGRDDERITDSIEVYLDHPMDFMITTDPPSNQTVIGGPITIQLVPLHIDPIVDSELYIDGELYAKLTDYPWSVPWDTRLVEDGDHQVSATIWRADGEQHSHERVISTDNCEVLPFEDHMSDFLTTDDGGVYYVYQYSPFVSRWHPDSGWSEEWLGLEADLEPVRIVPMSDGNLVVMTSAHDSTRLFEVDIDANAAMELPPPPAKLQRIQPAPGGRVYGTVWVNNVLDELYVYDPATGWSMASADYPRGTPPRIDGSGTVWSTTTTQFLRHTIDAGGAITSTEVIAEHFNGMQIQRLGEDTAGNLLALTDRGVERIDTAALVNQADYFAAVRETMGGGALREPLAFDQVKHRPGCSTLLVYDQVFGFMAFGYSP